MNTVKDLFDAVLALMFAKDAEREEYEGGFFALLNLCLAENFALNNNLRRARGEEPLQTIPELSLESDALPYEETLNRALLPLGIAATLFADDDETGIANVYREQYEAAKTRLARAVPREMRDVW